MVVSRDIGNEMRMSSADLQGSYQCIYDRIDDDHARMYVFYDRSHGDGSTDYPKIDKTMQGQLGLYSNNHVQVRFVSGPEEVPSELTGKKPVSLKSGLRIFRQAKLRGLMEDLRIRRNENGKISYFVPAEKSESDSMDPESPDEAGQRNSQRVYRQEETNRMIRRELGKTLGLDSSAKKNFEERTYESPDEVPSSYVSFSEFMSRDNGVTKDKGERLVFGVAPAVTTSNPVRKNGNEAKGPEEPEPAIVSEPETEEVQPEQEENRTYDPDEGYSYEDEGYLYEEGPAEEDQQEELSEDQQEEPSEDQQENEESEPEPEDREAPAELPADEPEKAEEAPENQVAGNMEDEPETAVAEDPEPKPAEEPENDPAQPSEEVAVEDSGKIPEEHDGDVGEYPEPERASSVAGLPEGVFFDGTANRLIFDCDMERPVVMQAMKGVLGAGRQVDEIVIGKNCSMVHSDAFLLNENDGTKQLQGGMENVSALSIENRDGSRPLTQDGVWIDGLPRLSVVTVDCGNDGIGNLTLEKGSFKYCEFTNPGFTRIPEKFMAGNVQNLCVKSAAQISEIGDNAFNKFYDKTVVLPDRKKRDVNRQYLLSEIGKENGEFHVWELTYRNNIKALKEGFRKEFAAENLAEVRKNAALVYARTDTLRRIGRTFEGNARNEVLAEYNRLFDTIREAGGKSPDNNIRGYLGRIALMDFDAIKELREYCWNKGIPDFDSRSGSGSGPGKKSLWERLEESSANLSALGSEKTHPDESSLRIFSNLNLDKGTPRGTQVSWDVSSCRIRRGAMIGQEVAFNHENGIRTRKDLMASSIEMCDYLDEIIRKENLELNKKGKELGSASGIKNNEKAELLRGLDGLEERGGALRSVLNDMKGEMICQVEHGAVRIKNDAAFRKYCAGLKDSVRYSGEDRSFGYLNISFGELFDSTDLRWDKNEKAFRIIETEKKNQKEDQEDQKEPLKRTQEEKNVLKDAYRLLDDSMLNREGVGDLAFAFGMGPSIYEDNDKNKEYQKKRIDGFIADIDKEKTDLQKSLDTDKVALSRLESSTQYEKEITRLEKRLEHFKAERDLAAALVAARAITDMTAREKALNDLEPQVQAVKTYHAKDKDRPESILDRIIHENASFSRLVAADKAYLDCYGQMMNNPTSLKPEDFAKLESLRQTCAGLHSQDNSGLADISKVVQKVESSKDLADNWTAVSPHVNRINRYSDEISEIARRTNTFAKNAYIKTVISDHKTNIADPDPKPKSNIDLLLEGDAVQAVQWDSKIEGEEGRLEVLKGSKTEAENLEQSISEKESRIRNLEESKLAYEQKKEKADGQVEYGEGTHAWNGKPLTTETEGTAEKKLVIDRSDGLPEGTCHKFEAKGFSNNVATGKMVINERYMGSCAYDEKPPKDKKDRHIMDVIILNGTHTLANLGRMSLGMVSGFAVSLFMPPRQVLSQNIVKCLRLPFVLASGATFGISAKTRNRLLAKCKEHDVDTSKGLTPETLVRLMVKSRDAKKERKEGLPLDKNKAPLTKDERIARGNENRSASCLNLSAANSTSGKEKESGMGRAG